MALWVLQSVIGRKIKFRDYILTLHERRKYNLHAEYCLTLHATVS